MTVSETQIRIVKEEATTDLLRKGYLPTASLITKSVAAYFADKQAGLPRFIYREAHSNQTSNKDDYNNMMYEIRRDLYVGFENIKDLNNEILAMTSFYESNRIKINRKLQDLEILNERLEQRKLLVQQNDVVGDNFTDFLSIDFLGDQRRNIPKTTAFVNLLTNEVEIPRRKGKTFKYSITDSDVRFLADKGTPIHLSPLSSLLSDTMYDAWRCVVESTDDSGLTGILIVALPEPINVSNVSIAMQSGRKLGVMLELSSDGGNTYHRLEERQINNTYQWLFPTEKITHLRFQMKHKEPTNANGEMFDYVFGVKRIEVLEVLYEDNATLVSKPYALDSLKQIESVVLDADESIHASTSIRYFFGLDDGESPVEWNEIPNKKEYNTGEVETLRVNVDKYTDKYGKKVYDYYGQQFYSLLELPKKATLANTQIHMGRNMWLKEIIPAPFTIHEIADESDIVTYQTGPQDWVRTASPFKGFVHINGRRDLLSQNHFHRYTLYMESEVDDEFEATIYTSNSNENKTQSTWVVYVNGEKNKGRTNRSTENPMNSVYNISLSKGWNKIEVYAYARQENEQINLDFYRPNMRYNIYGVQQQLTEVSLYDLINNSTSRTPTRFAIDERERMDGSKFHSIIVNYNPKQLDLMPVVSNNNDGSSSERIIPGDGIEYDVLYKQATNELLDSINVRFMAILTKESTQIETTPSMRGYKLQFK